MSGRPIHHHAERGAPSVEWKQRILWKKTVPNKMYFESMRKGRKTQLLEQKLQNKK